MKKKPSTKKESIKLQTFFITIKDSYHSCTYPFRLPETVSYADIAKAIAKKFKTEIPPGCFFSEEGIEL